MKVTFENVLLCDVDSYIFEHKEYISIIVYQSGRLYRISIPKSIEDTFTDHVGRTIFVDTIMSVYDGKIKFKYLSFKES